MTEFEFWCEQENDSQYHLRKERRELQLIAQQGKRSAFIQSL